MTACLSPFRQLIHVFSVPFLPMRPGHRKETVRARTAAGSIGFSPPENRSHRPGDVALTQRTMKETQQLPAAIGGRQERKKEEEGPSIVNLMRPLLPRSLCRTPRDLRERCRRLARAQLLPVSYALQPALPGPPWLCWSSLPFVVSA